MTAIAFYVLKVILCSGILFLYYHIALRNQVFHQWNRFYLLASVTLSLVLPLIQFTLLFEGTNQSNAAQILRSFQEADSTLEALAVVSGNEGTFEQWLVTGYCLVSALLLLFLIASFLRIAAIIRKHSVQAMNKVKFVNTTISGTPFSFFSYVFWNQDIPLQSSTGRQIFQHEMVHVEEKHSLDKLFMQLVLIVCWCNPFFWLVRRELHAIHEFIADQKSVDQRDMAAFASAILHAAYPQHYQSLVNPFFQTSIKRRIIMLTKMRNPVTSYISRMIALPLIAATVLAFTVRTNQNADVESKTVPLSEKSLPGLTTKQAAQSDTLPRKTKDIRSVDVRKDAKKNVADLTITYTDGTSEKMTAKEARKRGLISGSGNRASTANREPSAGNKIEIRKAGVHENQPLFVLDGKEISKEEMDKIDPNTIEAINVLKDKYATDKYGEKGKNGVVEISSKKDRQPLSGYLFGRQVKSDKC